MATNVAAKSLIRSLSFVPPNQSPSCSEPNFKSTQNVCFAFIANLFEKVNKVKRGARSAKEPQIEKSSALDKARDIVVGLGWCAPEVCDA